MSDDEVQFARRPKTIRYGSLEEKERKRQYSSSLNEAGTTTGQLEDIESEEDYEESLTKFIPKSLPGSSTQSASSLPGSSSAVVTTSLTSTSSSASSSSIYTNNTSSAYINKIDKIYYGVEKEVDKNRLALLEEYERKKRARQINVSTDDLEVKRQLRQINEPICFFGEGPAERRKRLKELIAKLGEDAIKQKTNVQERKDYYREQDTSTWYHEGPESLRVARFWIAHYSLPRAKHRLEKAREALEIPSATRASRMVELQKRIQSLSPFCSQVGDNRPLSGCAFNEQSNLLLTSSWSGVCKLWDVPSCNLKQTLRGHVSYVGGVAFRPGVMWDEENVVAMGSGGHDGSVKLWSYNSEETIAEITGHMPHRVSKLAFHPSGRFLATACYDASWRLWDLEQRTEVLHQEGHVKATHCLRFQTDGSVIATGGLDTFGRVWDLRTGRCIMFLDGHLGSIFGVDFSPNGFHIATGSQDNSCKIWDLRRRQPIYTIPAHLNLISDVKYQPDNGNYLVTCSYDCTVKVWSNKTWQPLKTLQGHDGKIMSLDISPDSEYIATTSYDRTFKLWTSAS